MSGGALPYRLADDRAPQMGLIVLQADESIERDFRRLTPPGAELLVGRVPSGAAVTPETLSAMAGELTAAASRFPSGVRFATLAYGCTSGAAEIGPARVARLLRAGADAATVTDPVSALLAACRALGARRLALVSPYAAQVSDRLRRVLAESGVETPAFGSFDVPDEARVVRIDANSIAAAAETVASRSPVDAVFLSCTNLRTLSVLPEIEARLDRPVLSSNQVLAWHMARLAGVTPPADAPGRLFARTTATV